MTALVMGCEDAEPDTKDFPFLITLAPTNIDETGATFRGELIKEGMSPVTSYGFIWTTHELNPVGTHRIIIGEDFSPGTFEIRIDSLLLGGISYEVRAFATYSDKTVYGNTVILNSQGSEKYPWGFATNVKLNYDNWDNTFGSTDGTNGYVISQNGTAYLFDTAKNTFSLIDPFPVTGNTGTNFASATKNGIQYFIVSGSKNLYKMDNLKWSVQSIIPCSGPHWDYLGFSCADEICFLNTVEFYGYNPETNSWKQNTMLPQDFYPAVGAASLNDKVYTVTKDHALWEYSIELNSWEKIAVYPGNINDRLISFAYNNQVYFGLSYHKFMYGSSGPIDNKMWSYDPLTGKWTDYPDFPNTITSEDGFFFFFIENELFFGSYSDDYNIWTFNPAKK